jgi:hypothetical protein
LLNKEFRLAASPLSWIFLIAAGMTMLPGYPILVGAFFVCFGVFHSFQNAREANDVLFTVLLPVRKRDFVRAKYAFSCCIQLLGFVIMAALTALRMTALAEGKAYVSNALMNPSPLFLAFVLLIYTAFNVFFLGGFFRTAYKLGMPFLSFGLVTLALIVVGEALHFFPGLGFLNTTSGERLGLQFTLLAIAAVIYALGTTLSCRASMARFEKIDL